MMGDMKKDLSLFESIVTGSKRAFKEIVSESPEVEEHLICLVKTSISKEKFDSFFSDFIEWVKVYEENISKSE